jgi:hypothetical protein
LEGDRVMDKEKEIKIAIRVLETIRLYEEPKLSYKEEKDVVQAALHRYIDYLKSSAYDIGNR